MAIGDGIVWWRACVIWPGNVLVRIMCAVLLIATSGTSASLPPVYAAKVSNLPYSLGYHICVIGREPELPQLRLYWELLPEYSRDSRRRPIVGDKHHRYFPYCLQNLVRAFWAALATNCSSCSCLGNTGAFFAFI